MKSFFSPGKILLCGEYAVTLGVEALAVPVKKGQWMQVWEFISPGTEDRVIWEAKDADKQTWLNESFELPLTGVEVNEEEQRLFLLKLLLQVPLEFWRAGKSYRIETQLEFERNSGLGSSSSMIANFARWSGVDAQAIQTKVFGGSGYDVAVAETHKSLVFWRVDSQAHWCYWTLSQELTADWRVVFLGEKQNSRTALLSVSTALAQMAEDAFLMNQLQQICTSVKTANSVPMLEAGLEMWQAVLGMSLGLQTPYQHFGLSPIKGGLCKWLGAWGGDMMLVNGTFAFENEKLLSQFRQVAWNDLVISE